MSIVIDNSRVVNKLEASLTDNAIVIIYDRHMFIVQATGYKLGIQALGFQLVGIWSLGVLSLCHNA
jgi:hypothetical protein